MFFIIDMKTKIHVLEEKKMITVLRLIGIIFFMVISASGEAET